MKKNKLSELTIDELNKQKNSSTGFLLGSGIVMLILISTLLYLIIKNQNFSLTAIVPILLLMMVPAIIKVNQINSEIKSRKL